MDATRWKTPPSVNTTLVAHDWELNLDHGPWAIEMAAMYRFESTSELLRHLVFVANAESKARKKLIFKIIRCLHCNQSNRAGFIPKETHRLEVFAFQLTWLNSVQALCGHASLEKTVRIIFDFYKKSTHGPGDEAARDALFWTARDVVRLETKKAAAAAAAGDDAGGKGDVDT
jgi:hypothetical protein